MERGSCSRLSVVLGVENGSDRRGGDGRATFVRIATWISARRPWPPPNRPRRGTFGNSWSIASRDRLAGSFHGRNSQDESGGVRQRIPVELRDPPGGRGYRSLGDHTPEQY